MKPRVKASLLAVLASLGLMGGCKDSKKMENPNTGEITATSEETQEPTTALESDGEKQYAPLFENIVPNIDINKLLDREPCLIKKRVKWI